MINKKVREIEKTVSLKLNKVEKPTTIEELKNILNIPMVDVRNIFGIESEE